MIPRLVKKAVSFLFVALMIIVPVQASQETSQEHNLTDEELHAFMGIITNFILMSDSTIVEIPTLTTYPESNTTDNNIVVEVHASVGNIVYVNGIEAGTVEANGTVTITIPLNLGANEVRITVKDTAGHESEALVLNIYTNAVNNAPVGEDDSNNTNEDTSIDIDVLANDSDMDGNPLNITNLSTPTHGTTIVVANKVRYTPNTNWSGTDTFTYTPNDGIEDGNEVTVKVTVTAVNDAPIGVADAITTLEDTAVDIDVLANDSDIENSTLSITNLSTPTYGTVSVDNNKVHYTPNANYHGTDTFSYTPNDGTVDGNTVTVTVTVSAVNDAPVGVDDGITTNEDTAVDIDVLANDSDIDGNNPLTITNLSTPIHGTVSVVANKVRYTPNANWSGTDTFTYTPNDSTVDGNAVTVTVAVTAVNDAPVSVADAITTAEDTAVDIDVLSNDSDEEGNPLSITNLSTSTNGTTSVVNNKVHYTPNANYNGTDTFTYTPNDGTVDGNEVMVTVTVTAVNDAPVAQEGNITVNGNSGDNDITLTATDIDSGTLTYAIVTPPEHGELSGTAPNLTYTPSFNYDGTDSFTFKANDGDLDSSVVTFSIVVKESIEKQIVRRHNVYRNLEFTDSNLTWDTTLATHAQQWADYLATHYTQAERNAGQSPHASVYDKDTHGLPYEGEGENIAWASAGLKYIRDEAVDISVENSATENNEFGAVDMWANEKTYYDYANNTGNGEVVGHYTQVVWQKSTKVGCGIATSTTDLPGEHIVCRYYIAGNLSGTKPYCTNYSVGQYYNDTTLKFTDTMINGKTFQNTKVLEDRENCVVSDMTGETLVVNSDGTGTFQNFHFFNNNSVWNFNFTKTIDAEGVLHMTGQVDGKDSSMSLQLIGQDATYYYTDAEWTLDVTDPGYTRRSIFKLEK